MKKLMLAVVMAVCGTVLAEETPVMVSLVTPVQYPARDCDVKGFGFSLIYGECDDFTGFDLGIVNNVYGDFTGLALGGVNIAREELYGAQVGLVNFNRNAQLDWDKISIGLQFGVFNYADSFCGLQDGIVNVARGPVTGLQSAMLNMGNDVYGAQFGFVNVTREIHGAQLGWYGFLCVNYAESVSGCQLGIVNIAGRVESGLQIGLVNVNQRNGWAPVLPIVNGGF